MKVIETLQKSEIKLKAKLKETEARLRELEDNEIKRVSMNNFVFQAKMNEPQPDFDINFQLLKKVEDIAMKLEWMVSGFKKIQAQVVEEFDSMMDGGSSFDSQDKVAIESIKSLIANFSYSLKQVHFE